MIKPQTIAPIKIKLKGENTQQIAFYPRMAFQSEREDVAKQIAEVGAETIGKGKKIFEIQRQAVAEWSIKVPELIEKVKGENQLVPLVADVKNAPDGINRFFAEHTVEHEEIISKTYYAFLNLMEADVDFL